jgi:histidine triad (HIT) family protein
VFCAIITRRSPAYIVYEDSHTLAFLDLFPYTRGHLLIVPKRHVDRLTELQEGEHGRLLEAVSRVCRRVERLSSNYNVALNQGRLAGQIVFHLHFHVIPRYDARNPFDRTDRPRLDETQAREMVQLLSAE